MIRIPVLLLLTLLTSPLRILVTLRLWLVRRKNTVLVWTIGGGRKPLDAKGFVRLISALEALERDRTVGGLRIERVRHVPGAWDPSSASLAPAHIHDDGV